MLCLSVVITLRGCIPAWPSKSAWWLRFGYIIDKVKLPSSLHTRCSYRQCSRQSHSFLSSTPTFFGYHLCFSIVTRQVTLTTSYFRQSKRNMSRDMSGSVATDCFNVTPLLARLRLSHGSDCHPVPVGMWHSSTIEIVTRAKLLSIICSQLTASWLIWRRCASRQHLFNRQSPFWQHELVKITV